MNYGKFQESFERIEVAVPVQQGVACAFAERGDQTVDRFSHGIPEPATLILVSGALACLARQRRRVAP